MTLLFFILAALVYGASSFVYGAEHHEEPGEGSAASRWARPLLALAAILHMLAIGAQCIHGDHPLKNIFLATSFGALIAVGGFLLLSWRRRLEALGPVMAPIGLMGLVLGVLFSRFESGRLPAGTAMASLHVTMAALGFAGFTLAAAIAGLYLVRERRLRAKAVRLGQHEGLSLTGIDRLHHRLVLFVVPVFTLAIVTGVLWVLDAGGPEMLRERAFELGAGGVAWLASVSLLVARAVWGTRGRRSAWLTLLSFIAVLLIVISYGVRT